MKSVIAAAGLVAVAQAFTQPVQPPTYGSLLTPDLNTPVTTGESFEIKWSPKEPTNGATVSLVLCKGPSTNCVLQDSAIVEKVPAAQASYSWSVPCSLPEGVQATDSGYGMLIIVDGTGEFQYSTQFSVKKGSSCSASSGSASSSASPPFTFSSTNPPFTFSTSVVATSSDWDAWSSSTDVSTFTGGAAATSAKYSSAPAVITTKPAEATYSYQQPSSSAAAVTTSATLKPYTGAAAMPSAFANAAGIVGAAAIAMFAL